MLPLRKKNYFMVYLPTKSLLSHWINIFWIWSPKSISTHKSCSTNKIPEVQKHSYSLQPSPDVKKLTCPTNSIPSESSRSLPSSFKSSNRSTNWPPWPQLPLQPQLQALHQWSLQTSTIWQIKSWPFSSKGAKQLMTRHLPMALPICLGLPLLQHCNGLEPRHQANCHVHQQRWSIHWHH